MPVIASLQEFVKKFDQLNQPKCQNSCNLLGSNSIQVHSFTSLQLGVNMRLPPIPNKFCVDDEMKLILKSMKPINHWDLKYIKMVSNWLIP